MAELCREFGISRATGYKWWRRYQKQGVAGLEERSRKPHASPRRTAIDIEQRIVELRRKTPDWGARKLRVKLAKQGIDLPVSTIHRILLRYGLVAEQDRGRLAPKRSSGSSRTNCGRWTSKEYRQPGKQRGCCRCRSSTTTAATCWVCGAAADRGEGGPSDVGRGLQRERVAATDADGPRHAVVEQPGSRLDAIQRVADAAGDRVEIQRHSASANARQGGAAARQHATSFPASRSAAAA